MDTITPDKTENQTTLNKAQIKEFAVNARKKLLESITNKCHELGITEKEIRQPDIEASDSIVIDGKVFDKQVKDQRIKLVSKINQTSFSHVVDEVAYTWFNRFIALYFMEVHNYLDHSLKIVSSLDSLNHIASKAPDFLPRLDKNEIFKLTVEESNFEEVYKKLIIAQCNALYDKMPFLFEKIYDETELLFPTGLLNQGSVIRQMIEIPVEDWQEVEIIGWLYQYYNTEEKNRVINAKQRYKIEEIPYATQLFTPKWIVKYMTQNSLGRLWQEAYPDSKLKESMEFYLEPRNLTEEDIKALEPYINKGIKPEDIKVFDPACGSGHILIYAFDILYQIYKESGYLEKEIPELILKNNLYGLDICERAIQLARLALLMKASNYTKKFNIHTCNVYEITNSSHLSNNALELVCQTPKEKEEIQELFTAFKEAKIYGSLIKAPKLDYDKHLERISNIEADPLLKEELKLNLKPILDQAKLLTGQYDVTITNPPYMGNKYMHPKLSEFIGSEYPENKSDLFSAFMEFIPKHTKKTGHIGLVTPFVWMFIKSYESLRNYIINSNTLSSLIQLEYNAFEAACVPVATFTTRNYAITYPAECIKLSDFTGTENQPIKTLEAIENPNISYRYTTYSKDFHSIPGSPIAYWASDRVREIFIKSESLGNIAQPRQGLITGDVNLFLKFWNEVNFKNIGFDYKTRLEASESKCKWFPYNKGGDCRRWYGNNEYVVNWYNDGYEIRNFTDEKNKLRSRPQNMDYYFKQCVTWSSITSSNFSIRYSNYGALFDVAGSAVFPEENIIKYFAGLLNTKIITEFLMLLNPTLNFIPGNIYALPVIIPKDIHKKRQIENIVERNIQISKTDWDSFETSWDFEEHPLLKFKDDSNKVENAFKTWQTFVDKQFYQLKANEEELNKIFIEIYGLQDEMTSDVAEKDVTINKADEKREIKSLITYAVGCIMGRYSLDQKGLVYAGGEFDPSKYKSLKVDEDAILPVLGDCWFEDDIVGEFKDFLKAAFGKETLSINLDYIAKVLNDNKPLKQPAEVIIRNYFLKDFYTDHLQVYKKRPIYWMFTSGKEKAFNCLVYLHRYHKGTLSDMRTRYLDRLQGKLMDHAGRLEKEGQVKEKLRIEKHLEEMRKYYEVLKDAADKKIDLDLDDGVKVNYSKFDGLVVDVKGLNK